MVNASSSLNKSPTNPAPFMQTNNFSDNVVPAIPVFPVPMNCFAAPTNQQGFSPTRRRFRVKPINPMIIKCAILLFTCSSFTGVTVFLAEMDAPTVSLVITGLTGLVTAIFGGLIMWGQAKSKSRIEEMKIEAEIERIKNEAHQKVQEVRAEAQKAVSLVNATALSNIQAAMTVNTTETIKSAAAADQTKERVERLEAKLPTPAVNLTPRHGE